MRYGWGGFDLRWHVTPPGFLEALRTTATRRISYVDDLDAAIDHEFALDPIGLLGQKVAYQQRWGLDYVGRMHAEFGFLPGLFTAPDSGAPMSYSPHGVVVLLGHFGATSGLEVETWSCSTSHDVVGSDEGLMPNTIGAPALEDLFDAWAALIAHGSGVGFPPHVWLDGVAYYRRKADGTSTTGTWERYMAPTPAAGTVTTAGNELPYQLATVVTEDAGGARKGRFGRFYLPALGTTTLNDQIDVGVAAGAVAAVATTMGTVNTILNGVVGDDTETVVASAIGSGENRPVRSLRVGRVFDTQRRRRRSVAEDYQITPFQAI